MELLAPRLAGRVIVRTVAIVARETTSSLGGDVRKWRKAWTPSVARAEISCVAVHPGYVRDLRLPQVPQSWRPRDLDWRLAVLEE
jgi:hypothetical protein